MTNIRGVIFDMDGTLIDSMSVWENIDREFLAKRGLLASKDYIDAICPLSFRETAEYTISHYNLSETPEMLMEEWHKMAFEAYASRIPLKPFAKPYLELLKAKGLVLSIATSLSQPLCEAALHNHQIHSLFDAICFTSEVPRGKEFPDIYLHTANKLNLSPENCLVFEDILPAVKSAKAAGMTVCGVFDESSAHMAQDIKKNADYYIMNFQQAPVPAL